MNLVEGAQAAWDGYHQVASIRASVAAIQKPKSAAEVAKATKEFDEKLANVGGSVSHGRKFYGPPPPTNFANLNGYLLARLEEFNYGDIAPTEAMMETYGSDWSKLKAVSDQWRTILKKDLPALNAILKKNGIAAIQESGPALGEPPAPNKKYIPAPEPPPSGHAAPAVQVG